jgi:hypothetical protein
MTNRQQTSDARAAPPCHYFTSGKERGEGSLLVVYDDPREVVLCHIAPSAWWR